MVVPRRQAVVAEAVGSAVAGGALIAGLSLWWVLSIGVGSAVALLMRVRRRSVLDRLATAARFFLHTGPIDTRAIDVPGLHAADAQIGALWRNTRVVTVIEVLSPAVGITRLDRDQSTTTSRLPLWAIAQCLQQNDITLCGIDITIHGERSQSGSPATEVYEKLIGPLPAVATRTVRLAITFDVQRNEDAVRRRGGSRTGAHRCAVVSTTRVVRALERAHLEAHIMSASEIDSACMFSTRGVAVSKIREKWKYVPLPGVWDFGYALAPQFLTDELLTSFGSVPSVSNIVAINLRPGSSDDVVSVAASCRFTTRIKPVRVRTAGLISMNGRQRAGLLSAMPTAATRFDSAVPSKQLSERAASALSLPATGCGQVLGSDAQGLGVAVVLYGRMVGSVHIAAEIYLAQQIVFRAVATGARVIVRSDRPHAWTTLVDSIATPKRLHLEGRYAQAGSQFDVLVIDQFSAPPTGDATTAGTTIVLTDHPDRWPTAIPDLSIVQPGACGDRIRVRSALIDTELTLVTTSLETGFIGRPRSLRTSPVA